MSSLVDLVVAAGLFMVTLAMVLGFVMNYYSSYLGVLEDSELRTASATLNQVFFGGRGVPSNWETKSDMPVRVGLMMDLYRTPVIVAGKNSSLLPNFTVNFSMPFDPPCLNTTRESTIRVYNETNHEQAYSLFNRTYCPGGAFLKSADLTMNVTLPVLTPKRFFIYHSPEPGVQSPPHGVIAFPTYTNGTTNVTNFTVVRHPTEQLKMVSPSKMRALRNLSHAQVFQTLGSGFNFHLEVDAP